MPLTLHAAFVPSALQMLGTARHLIDRAAEWADANALGEAEMLDARLHPEMLPFAYQIKSVAVHTADAIEAVEQGLFAPNLDPPPSDFSGLRARLDAAVATLRQCDEAALEAKIGAPMRFAFKDFRMDFKAEDFLLSFSQPNYYFHASTAYAILRQQGVPIGKRDFMGALRLTN